MDDLKLCAQNDSDLEGLLATVKGSVMISTRNLVWTGALKLLLNEVDLFQQHPLH